MNEIEIMFEDLSPSKKKEILAAYKIKDMKDMNWDVIPIAIIPTPE
jgi:hypothetical protein